MKRRVVVIGGTAAGMSAATKAKRTNPGLDIIVLERTGFVSYGSCGLPYFIGGLISTEKELISLTVEDAASRGIHVLLHKEAISIDRNAKRILYKDTQTGDLASLSYDSLVIATGAVPVYPAVPNIKSQGIYTVRTVEDGMVLRNIIDQGQIKKALIIGGGFIGLEMAEQLCLRGIRTTMFEAMPRLLPSFDEEYAMCIQSTLEEHGVEVLVGQALSSIEVKDGCAAGAFTVTGTYIEADLIICSTGVKPNSELAMAAGLDAGLRGGIVVDKEMRTSDGSIWACGDCVQMDHLLTGKETYIPLGTTANKQGRVAGANVAGQKEQFSGVLGSQITKVFNWYISSTGLGREAAIQAGFNAESEKIVKLDRASYYPGGVDCFLTLIFDGSSGRILGAQALGGISVAGRINALAVAISSRMTITDLNEVDFVYAPPVAPVYDPMAIAASQGIKKLRPIATGSLP
jgi:NADPH-dependent 2,4-dienoyl-CoA reductase/sulfur reductase-like enzyme